MKCPTPLAEIVQLFETFSEQEKRENLLAFAEQAKSHEPRAGEFFDFQEIRKDLECSDTVGIFLRIDSDGKAAFRVALGPQVQTLTRAMAAIFCRGLNGSKPEDIVQLSNDFVEKIVGSKLMRIRSQNVFYIFARMKSACAEFLAKNPHERD